MDRGASRDGPQIVLSGESRGRVQFPRGRSGFAQTSLQIRLGHVLPETHSRHVAGKTFAETVAHEQQGRTTIQLFAAGKLGDEPAATSKSRSP